MNFQNIDWHDLQFNSKSVYKFLKKYTKFKEIEDYYKGEKLKFYAEKHNIEYAKIIKLFDIGFEKGKQFAKAKTENSLPEYRKDYWFNLAKNFYVTTNLISSNGFHFKKNWVTHHEPEIIEKMGYVTGEYWFVWQKILENHVVFEPLFKVELDKIKYSSLTGTPFRFKAKITNLPDNLQKLGVLNLILSHLSEILIARKEDILKRDSNSFSYGRIFSYQIINDFTHLFNSFIKETANNKENGTFERHYSKYANLRRVITNCIAVFKDFKPVFDFDMSFMYEYELHGENWFKIIYDKLNETKISFDEITGLDSSKYLGYECKLPEPTVDKIYELMTRKEYIECEKEDFKAIFAPEPTPMLNPIKWIKKGQRKDEKEKRYRGHQTILHLFIKIMLQRKLNADEKRKTAKFFIDDYGEFFSIKSRDPVEKDINTHRLFLKEINDIIKKYPITQKL